jgi:hypothetical protein
VSGGEEVEEESVEEEILVGGDEVKFTRRLVAPQNVARIILEYLHWNLQRAESLNNWLRTVAIANQSLIVLPQDFIFSFKRRLCLYIPGPFKRKEIRKSSPKMVN